MFPTIKRTVAVLTAVAATFGAGAMASTANAEEPTPPNVEVAFTKVTDGTGFGTADQCWLNSANGYADGADGDKPGDNAADDGVVCSGDYVEYEMDLKFKGGVNNAVRLVPSAPDGFPLSYSSGKGSFCRSEGQLSAKGYNGGGCTFRAPDGYTNEVRQTLWYLADNHGGKPLRGQTMTFDLYTGDDADGWAKYSSVELEPVTVISMTYAEASVDTNDENDLEWGRDAKTLEGTLNISASPIRPKASRTAKGLSNRSIGWSGTLDLSAFPTGTYLKGGYDGKEYRPADGKLHLDSATDGTSFNIEIPTPKACGDGEHPNGRPDSCIEGDGRLSYTLHMDFDKGSPAYPDGTPATPVTNDGSELGTGKGEDYDTGSVGFIGYYGDDLSGRAGYSNNNWGVVHVTRRDIPDGKIFRKLLQTSKAEGQTIFEDGYTTFGKGDGERTLNYKYASGGYIIAEKVAAGTEIRVRLQINTKEVAGCRESGCKLTFYDSFDYTNKFLPSKGVVIRNGDRTYADGVKVAWATVPAVQGDDDKEPDTWHFNSTPDDEMPVDWSDGMPTEADVEEADDMSVKASYEITPEQAAGDDPWEAVFYVRMQEGTNYSQDHMLGVVETKDGNAVRGNYSGAVDGVSVLPMSATAFESVSVTDAQGGYRSAARPGDTLEYRLSSNIKDIKVYDGFKARFTACADPWLTGFRLSESDTDEWDMTALDKSKAVENGCAVGSTPLLFDYKGKATYTEESPWVYWTAKVSNFANASRTISSPARIEASTPASHGLKADGVVSEWSSDPAPVESRLGTEGMLTSASGSVTHAEAGADGLRYEWNIYNNLTDLSGEVSTVIKLPSNDDSKLANGGKGPDGTWKGYNRGSSKFTDYVLAGEPRLDDGDSTPTRLMYSVEDVTDPDKALNPDAYEWKAWDDLTAEQRRRVKAILVTSETTDTSDGTKESRLAASSGVITLRSDTAKPLERFNVWIGGNHGVAGVLNSVPFAASIKVRRDPGLYGTVWFDADSDGFINNGERGIPGVTVELCKGSDSGYLSGRRFEETVGRCDVMATTTTDGNGDYAFDAKYAPKDGSYVLTHVAKGVEGLKQTYSYRYHTDEDELSSYSDSLEAYWGVNEIEYIDFGYKPTMKPLTGAPRTGASTMLLVMCFGFALLGAGVAVGKAVRRRN